MTIKIIPIFGEPYTINVENIGSQSVDEWIKKNLNTDNIKRFFQQIEKPQYCYVEVTDRRISELVSFDNKDEAKRHLCDRFIRRLHERDPDFEGIVSDTIQTDEYGFNETSAWINDSLPLYKNWNSYILTFEEFLDQNTKEEFINNAIKQQYLFLTDEDYNNLICKAFGQKVIRNWHINMGITTDAVDKNGKTLHIFTTKETCEKISMYLNKNIIGIQTNIINGKRGVALLCAN